MTIMTMEEMFKDMYNELLYTVRRIEAKSILLEPEILETYISFNDRLEFPYVHSPFNPFDPNPKPSSLPTAHSIYLSGLKTWVETNNGLIHLYVRHPSLGTVTYFITDKALLVTPPERIAKYLLEQITKMVREIQMKLEEQWPIST